MRSPLPILGTAALLLASSTASAQDESDEYSALIHEAVAEFDGHRFEEARVLFRRAHELSPSARTLRGIGLASYELRDYVTAYRSLNEALVSTERPLTVEQRAEVSELVARAARFIGVYRLATRPARATLQVDGRGAALDPEGRLVLALGEHTVSAGAEGFEPAERRVVVGGGEDETLSITLAAVTEEAPAEAVPVVVAPSSLAAADPLPGALLLAVGGAVAVAGIVTGASWWVFQEEQLGLCAGAPCGNEGSVRSARDLATGTTLALAITGAGLAVTGIFVLATSSANGATSVRCAPGGLGLGCAGRF